MHETFFGEGGLDAQVPWVEAAGVWGYEATCEGVRFAKWAARVARSETSET